MEKDQSLDLFEKFKDSFIELYTWIQDTISPYEVFDFVKIIAVTLPEEDSDNKNKTWCYFAFFTSRYAYHFSAVKPYKDEPEGFISGEVSSRKPLAGESLSGSNSLTGGGVYSEQTWINFLKRVIRYEIVQLSPSAYKTI